MPRGRGFGYGGMGYAFAGRGMGYGFGPGRGWGNPTPYCRFYPWLPRGWWAYPQYNQWQPNAPVSSYGWQTGNWNAPVSWQNRNPYNY